MKVKEDVVSFFRNSSQYSRWVYDQETLDTKFNKRRLEVYQVNFRKFYDNPNLHYVFFIIYFYWSFLYY